jgi:4-hydroxy-3-methylbut-2-enyl diphosphate reductase
MVEKQLLLASPRGFCAGVDRAIEIVELALELYGPPVYVRHEIVHNRHVVEQLREQGAIFTEDLNEIPAGSLVIFSAHGISPTVREEARSRGLRSLDATCPLVTKVHREALRYARAGHRIVLVGHRGHVEVEGTLGHAPNRMSLVETLEDVAALDIPEGEPLALLTQTTLSLDDTREIMTALQQRFPTILLPNKDDICYATQNRQNAVKRIAARCELVLVVGAPGSSNSNRLVEVARAHGARAELIESADEIPPAWLAGIDRVGVTAGASTPEFLVLEVIARLRSLGYPEPERVEIVREDVSFTLPLELKRDLAEASAG